MISGRFIQQNRNASRWEGDEPDSIFDDGQLRVVFWGVLYNRDVLNASGKSNARLAAEAYLRDKENGWANLDGSFTILYISSERCGLVRDHHGTHCPIYYTVDGSFSSSLSHFPSDIGKYVLCMPSLTVFLQRGLLLSSCSPYQGICRLEAGCQLVFEAPSPYVVSLDYSKGIPDRKPTDVEVCSRRYGELHVQAIQRRIADSRKVGILLSGGYDSGSNLAALRSVYDGQVDSYSIGFKGDTWTELPLSRIMSETFSTRHHEYEIDGSEILELPSIVRFLGEPFVEGGLMVNYCVMRLVGDDKPDVILGGDGSDQYFGTAGREVALHYLVKRVGMLPLAKLVAGWINRPALDTGGKLSRVNFHADRLVHILEGDRFGFSDRMIRSMLQHPGRDWNPVAAPLADTRSFDNLYNQHALVSDLMLVINRVILFKASRMAQMFRNNLTFPFMDLELYRFLQTLPVSMKCRGENVWKIARGHSTSKYLLKHHYKPLLPEAITARKKQGGFAPMPLFFKDSHRRTLFKDFILSSGIFSDYLSRPAVETFLSTYDREIPASGKWFWYRQNKALQYFNLLTLVTWWEEFVGHRTVVWK